MTRLGETLWEGLLRALTLAQHPGLGESNDLGTDPWLTLQRRLIGLRLLTPGDSPEVARIRRLVAAHLTIASPPSVSEGQRPENMPDHGNALGSGQPYQSSPEGAGPLEASVKARPNRVAQSQASPAPWEFDALIVTLPHLLAQHPTRGLAGSAGNLSEKVKNYRSLPAAASLMADCHRIFTRLAASDPANAAWQRDLSVSFHKFAIVASQSGERVAAATHFHRCHEVLQGMKAKGSHLDPNIASVLEQLDQAAPQNYAGMVEAAAASRGVVAATPVPTVNIPDPLSQPRRKISPEELRESARVNFGKGYWEAAAGALEKLLAHGDPIEEVAPKLVACLLNARDPVMSGDLARAQALLRQLESAGHTTRADELRTVHATKLAPAKSRGGRSGDGRR